MRYSLCFDNIASGATADTFMTIAALIAPDTAGVRARLRSLAIGPADDTPVDNSLVVAVKRIADVSAGGVGTHTDVAGSALGKADPNQPNATVSGAVNFTAEPTAYETESLWTMGFNSRGGLIQQWEPKAAPVITADMLLGICVAPRIAAAVSVSGSIEFEIY